MQIKLFKINITISLNAPMRKACADKLYKLTVVVAYALL